MKAISREKGKIFIDREKIYGYLSDKEATEAEVEAVLNKALKLKGLSLEDAAVLLTIKDPSLHKKLLQTAGIVKDKIYGKRLVLFAPLYTGNKCSNNCLYCGFRKDNAKLHRVVLSQAEIEKEVEALLREGHKRVLMLCGESGDNPLEYFLEAIRTAYRARVGRHNIRRVNVEIAPMEAADFAKIKAEKIGTYVCFQETYDPVAYSKFHPKGSGPKADYEYRLTVMDRAMDGGIDDVGIGALFGLTDYRFEVLAMLSHAKHLEAVFGCGPHTVSVPRIEPADGAPLSTHIPHSVSDEDFKKLVAVIRISLPYTGMILSTRESESLRTELFQYGISQISAGSRTNPGAYSRENHTETGSQFSLGDHRTLDEVISNMIDQGYVPSFCTGCYRKGRVGNDFMDLAKPGLIKEFCLPNGIFTFQEYLEDFATSGTREKGKSLIRDILGDIGKKPLREKVADALQRIEGGERDIYF